jgi:hypothetical protein
MIIVGMIAGAAGVLYLASPLGPRSTVPNPASAASGPTTTVTTPISNTTATGPPTTAARSSPSTSQPAGATPPPTGAPTSTGSTMFAASGSATSSVATSIPAAGSNTPAAVLGSAPLAGEPLGLRVQAEQVQVVSRDYQVPVIEASKTVGAAIATLKAAHTALTADTKASQVAAGVVTGEIHTMATDQAARAQAALAYDRTLTTLVHDRHRMRAIAIALYVGGPTAPVRSAHAPANSAVGSAIGTHLGFVQETGDAVESLTIAESTTGSDLGPDTARVASAVRHYSDLSAKVRLDNKTLGLDRARVRADKMTLVTDRAKIDIAKAPILVDQTRLAAARHAQTVAEGEFVPPPTAVSATTPLAGGPSILGPPALTASQMIGWFNQSGYVNQTKATLSQLVNWYLDNGAIEGIRGDLAFAQAVHETAGFSSRDAVTFNDYAGVGHCDFCMSGLEFPSPEEGVIGQLQLLRIFADADSAQGLPQPLVLSVLNPAKVSALGCCETWNSLTGKWASDPNYGPEILQIYYSMLQYALNHPPVAPPTPPATPPAMPAAPPAPPGKPA